MTAAAIVGAISIAVLLLGMAADLVLCAWEDARWHREQRNRNRQL